MKGSTVVKFVERVSSRARSPAIFLVALLVVVALPTAGESTVPYGPPDFYPTPERPLGWRGDGTGAWPGAEVVAACDVDESALDRACRDFGVPDRFTDFRQLIARDDLDAVDVCLHNNLHRPVTVAALEGRVPLMPTARLALLVMLIQEGMYLSDRLGREVTADEVRQGSVSNALDVGTGGEA